MVIIIIEHPLLGFCYCDVVEVFNSEHDWFSIFYPFNMKLQYRYFSSYIESQIYIYIYILYVQYRSIEEENHRQIFHECTIHTRDTLMCLWCSRKLNRSLDVFLSPCGLRVFIHKLFNLLFYSSHNKRLDFMYLHYKNIHT